MFNSSWFKNNSINKKGFFKSNLKLSQSPKSKDAFVKQVSSQLTPQTCSIHTFIQTLWKERFKLPPEGNH